MLVAALQFNNNGSPIRTPVLVVEFAEFDVAIVPAEIVAGAVRVTTVESGSVYTIVTAPSVEVAAPVVAAVVTLASHVTRY